MTYAQQLQQLLDSFEHPPTFEIQMTAPRLSSWIKMPGNEGLGLFEASFRIEIYKRHNPPASFRVVNSDNGDIEYEL